MRDKAIRDEKSRLQGARDEVIAEGIEKNNLCFFFILKYNENIRNSA